MLTLLAGFAKMNKIIAIAFLLSISSPIFAQDRTVVNDDNVCWLLKRAVLLAGSDVEVVCPKKNS